MKTFKCGKKVFGEALFCFLFVLMLSNVESPIVSAKAPSIPKKMTVYYVRRNDPVLRGGYNLICDPIYISGGHAEVISVHSNNKKYIARYIDRIGIIEILPRSLYSLKGKYVPKNGDKATISVKVKKNGKIYKLSCKITVKKHPNLIKNLKIGSKDYAKYFKGYSSNTINKWPEDGAKIYIRLANGYKIDDILLTYKNTMDCKHIKNGSKVSLNNVESIMISIQWKNSRPLATYQLYTN